MQGQLVNEAAKESQMHLDNLYAERAEVEADRVRADDRLETLTVLIKAEEAKRNSLDQHLPKAMEAPGMAMPQPAVQGSTRLTG